MPSTVSAYMSKLFIHHYGSPLPFKLCGEVNNDEGKEVGFTMTSVNDPKVTAYTFRLLEKASSSYTYVSSSYVPAAVCSSDQ
jgi:hypothetical protein